jgi:hypothetical protein
VITGWLTVALYAVAVVLTLVRAVTSGLVSRSRI